MLGKDSPMKMTEMNRLQREFKGELRIRMARPKDGTKPYRFEMHCGGIVVGSELAKADDVRQHVMELIKQRKEESKNEGK